MEHIFLLQSDQRARAALLGALMPPYQVRLVPDVSALEGLLRRNVVEAVVLDVFDPSDALPFSALRRIRRRHPTLALIIASDFSGRGMDLYRLGRLSVDGVVRMEDRPHARDILAVVDGAIVTSLATRVLLSAAVDLPPIAQEAIRWSIEHAEEGPRVSTLAAALGMSSKTLGREMKTLGLLSPGGLLLWGRLIRASHLLERPGETVESVAFGLGYSTGGALGKAMKRHVGQSPSGLLKHGGLAWTLHAFQRRGLRPGTKEP